MSPDRAQSSRNAEVRNAAGAWEKASVIDAATRAAIQEAYPLDHPRLAPAWRALIFVIASVAIVSGFGGFVVFARADGWGTWIFFGALLTVATETLDRSRLRDNGSAAATSFWAVVVILAGLALAVRLEFDVATIVLPLAAAILFAIFSWRWGFEVYGAFSAVALFGLLAQFPNARLWWIVFGGLIVALASGLRDRASLPPPHRVALAGACAVGAVAIYAAVNRYSVDRLLVETLDAHSRTREQPSPTLRICATAATTLVPLTFLLWGLRTRRRLVLDLGIAFAALSLATLRYYVHLAPLWVILCASGAALLLAALGFNRKLRGSPGGEWGGFTVHPLYSGPPRGLAAAAAVAGFAPDARVPHGPDDANFTGGGGISGGGGAAGSF